MMEDDRTVLLLPGARFTRAGYAHPMVPPAVTIRTSAGTVAAGAERGRRALMSAAVRARPDLENVASPVQRGVVQDWDALEALCGHVLYNELGVEKGREPALMMAAPFNSSKHDRERLVKLLFEGFALPGLDVAAEPVLAAYGYGAPTGVVVDIAGDSTHIAVVSDWQLVPQTKITLPIGVADLEDNYLKLLRTEKAFVQALPDPATHTRSLLERLRIATGIVSTSARAAASGLQKMADETVTLDDGTTVTVGMARARFAEPLFNPTSAGLAELGLAQGIVQALEFLEADKRGGFVENMMVTGELAGTSGLNDRIKHDVDRLLGTIPPTGPEDKPVSATVLTPPTYAGPPILATWLGGCIACKGVFSQGLQMTKADYNEWGPSFVHTRPFKDA